METTKMSTKGQIVVPENLRKGFSPGDAFSVARLDDLIVLKKVEGLTAEERAEMEELEEIWKDIEAGNCETYSLQEFFKKMKEW